MGRGRRRARARVAVAGALLLCTATALPGQAALAAGTPGPYDFAPDARPVRGSASAAEAAPLTPGASYRSSLERDGQIYFSLDLDATSDVYVSATVVPPPGSAVAASDGVKVSVQDAEGRSCSFDTTTFGAVRSARPIAAWGSREISANRPRCKEAGTYRVLVQRLGTALSASDTWDLELFAASEPALRRGAAPTAPGGWNSAPAAPVTGEAVPRAGGSGFTSAAPVAEGVWSSAITPGRTLFYKVPLAWGEQFSATAELAGSESGDGYVAGALSLALYNPARGFVDDAGANYDGGQRAAVLDPVPPVAYGNRYAAPDRISAVRFAGDYYVVVHLAAGVAGKYGEGPFTLTLRVRVDGTTAAGPGYAGEFEPRGVFDAGSGDAGAGAGGALAADGDRGGGGDGGDTALTVLAVSGLGTGTVVLGGLGVWFLAARRGAGAR
ncbi:hypothetical protein SZN_18002 [Streptomyces zinciresistens K42]|uniref:Integral membrane protein n=1 Tax=Streptomyces zinciresistens K42 TaxID=700597 RepID=G2GDK5_9ACTN|nr:hypothetical protein [Streptomyces zinciresistens]EGX58426.1 hypothetical protein SZN_18002 [Streptomyces zinciresistens K42]